MKVGRGADRADPRAPSRTAADWFPAPLRLRPKNWRLAALTVAASVLAVTAWIVGVDLAFRAKLPAGYVAFFTDTSLHGRTAAMCLLAALEEIKFRLILMTFLTFVAAAVWRGKPPVWVFVVVIVVAQLANVWPEMVANLGYGSLRYLAVGSVWGWLYWRHGWFSALAAHASTHLILDPILARALL